VCGVRGKRWVHLRGGSMARNSMAADGCKLRIEILDAQRVADVALDMRCDF